MDIIELVAVITYNPFFLKYGLVGLFLNGLLSSVIPIPTEVTTVALLASSESKLMVHIVNFKLNNWRICRLLSR